MTFGKNSPDLEDDNPIWSDDDAMRVRRDYIYSP